MNTVVLFAVLGTAASAAFLQHTENVLREAEQLSGSDLVNYINKAQKLFTAKLSPRFANLPRDIKHRLMGSKYVALPAKYRMNEKTHNDIDNSTIPKSFDARTNWPKCASLRTVRDQSACGSGWAVAAVGAIMDRICIASEGKQQVILSADDILSCCTECGYGCEGGDTYKAWNYWTTDGIVTGSNYTTKSGCKPYPYPPCEHYIDAGRYKKCPKDLYPTNTCEYKCQDNYTISYDEDKHYGAYPYVLVGDASFIQQEIMNHGPVEVTFDVYEDFEHYSSGIYKHMAGEYVGVHAVKMLGWGTENGVDYWICANSWNSDWGENGFFRILRGENECGIESNVVAGKPK
uniref:Cathepsin B-like cysteine protease 1 n=1 Tax=Parelaphostrongylus tenuis TaxID=148309 RepID=Q2QA01_PARTN|nr:cathepsin B-like cysteine protease 1 [Parelaphostrongylus tenuis]